MACAFCRRSGEIGFREDAADVPKGSIVFAYGDMDALKNTCAIHASHGPNGLTLWVLGVPEAKTDGEAFEAFQDWHKWAFPKEVFAFVGAQS